MAFKLGATQKEHEVSETISLEKEQVYRAEYGMSEEKRKYLRAGLSSEDADFILDMPLKQQSAIYHKVDRRLVPMVIFSPLLAWIKLIVPSLLCCT